MAEESCVPKAIREAMEIADYACHRGAYLIQENLQAGSKIFDQNYAQNIALGFEQVVFPVALAAASTLIHGTLGLGASLTARFDLRRGKVLRVR